MTSTASTLPLILGFAALFFLLTLALLWSHWPKWLKVLLTLSVTGFYFIGFESVHALMGIPSTDALPERFVMLAAVVEEPTQKSSGSIFLWVNPLSLDKSDVTLLFPRAYKLPYSRKLHEQVNEGIKKGKDGVSQMGVSTDIKTGQNGLGHAMSWLLPNRDEQEIKISDLPVPQLPEK